MTIAYLGLGANLGDARQTLKDAVVCLAQQHALTVHAHSSTYRSAPVDASGDDFYNCVVQIDTNLGAHELLVLCHRVEHHFGRERPFRNAPRTLDIDILLYGNVCIEAPDLIVPHPRLTLRAFALVPLVEISAQIDIPGHGLASAWLPGVADQRIDRVHPPCQCQCTGSAGDHPVSPASGTCR